MKVTAQRNPNICTSQGSRKISFVLIINSNLNFIKCMLSIRLWLFEDALYGCLLFSLNIMGFPKTAEGYQLKIWKSASDWPIRPAQAEHGLNGLVDRPFIANAAFG